MRFILLICISQHILHYNYLTILQKKCPQTLEYRRRGAKLLRGLCRRSNVFRVRHPLDQLLRCRRVGKQVRENLSRCLSKERVLVVLAWEERRCDGRDLGGASHLVTDTPEWHSLIPWM